MSWIEPVFLTLLGMCLGSFLNVCIFRIPLKKSIINPPSSCPICGERIKYYDNIPVLSYILLGGRCRSCGEKISIQYPVVELATAFFSLALYFKYGLSFSYLIWLAVVSSLLIVSFIDLNQMIIPDLITLPGIGIGFLLSLFLKQISYIESLIGIIVGGGVLYLIALLFLNLTGRQGMGLGDIKLFAMIGAWLGWRPLPLIILISSISGIIIGGGALIISGKRLNKKIPFGPFLSLGTIIYILFGDILLNLIYGIRLDLT